jgi:regulator of protease activity HflC (stomatin/prohibitin superfamily)
VTDGRTSLDAGGLTVRVQTVRFAWNAAADSGTLVSDVVRGDTMRSYVCTNSSCRATFRSKSGGPLPVHANCPRCGQRASLTRSPEPTKSTTSTALAVRQESEAVLPDRPERASSIVERPFLNSPHFIALVVALGTVLLLTLIWLIAAIVGSSIVAVACLLAIAGITASVGYAFISFIIVKASAIQHHRREVPIFYGWGRLVLWEGNEGLLFLKNKRVSAVIYGPKAGGGTAIIYPVLGEELRIHIPLTLRPCEFWDQRIISGDGMHLRVRLTFWWRIQDERGLETFYLVVDREIHKATDTDHEQVLIPEGSSRDSFDRPMPDQSPRSEHHAAEIWIRKIVESCTRKLVASTTANNALIQMTNSPTGHVPLADAPDRLSSNLRDLVQAEVDRYGFYIDRIVIQEVQLPPDIQREIHELYKAKFIPIRTALEAEERYNNVKRSLEAVKDVIGVEATAMREILSTLRGSFMFGGLPPQLDKMLAPFVGAIAGSMAKTQSPIPIATPVTQAQGSPPDVAPKSPITADVDLPEK